MAKLLQRLTAAFPGATFNEYDDLGRPAYIVTDGDGLYLRVTDLHVGGKVSNEPSEFTGMTLRGPWDIRR